MKLLKPVFPVCNLSDVQYKFFVSEEYEKQEKKYEIRRKLSADKSMAHALIMVLSFNIV